MKRGLLAIVTMCILICNFQLVFAVENVTSNVTVNEGNIIKASDKRLLGFNNDAQWNVNAGIAGSTSANPAYYNAMKEYGLNIPLLRGFFQNIDWKDTIGDLSERGCDIYSRPYTFGMVEWIESTLAVTNNAEFVIVVNVEDSVENIQDMVRFLTLAPDDPNAVDAYGVNWAQKRVDAGLKEPVRIACFELGNETDGNFSEKTVNDVIARAEQYIAWCNPLIDGVEAVNENAKVSVLSYSMPNDGKGYWSYWNSRIIGSLGAKVDYIVCHYYYYNDGNQGYALDVVWFNNQIKQYINMLPVQSRPKIFLSEHAILVDNSLSSTDRRVGATCLRGALTTAEVINRLSNRADVGELAVYHSIFGEMSTEDYWGGHCWGVLRPYTSGVLMLSAVGEYFKLAYNAFGVNNVGVICSGNAYCANATSGFGNEILTASAHTTDEGGLNLILVNTNSDVGHNIVFSANSSYKLEKKVVLTNENNIAENMPSSPDNVMCKEELINDESTFTNYYIPPLSAVALYLAPMNKTYNGSIMDVKLNGVTVENNNPTIVCKYRKLEVECTLYDNGNMAAASQLSLMILKQNTDLNNIQAGDIMYIEQKDVVRERAYFECTMPKSTGAGQYIAYIANKSIGDGCYKAFEFDYEPSTEQSLIDDIEVTDAENDDYKVSCNIDFGNKFAQQKDFSVKVINSATGETAYIGQDKKSSNIQAYSFYMPREAISGTYKIILSYDDNGSINCFEKNFEYIKPKECVNISSAPTNQNGGKFTFADLYCDNTLTMKIKNITDNAVQTAIFVTIYDTDGKILAVKKGDTINMASEQTADYSISFSAMESSITIGALKAFVWEENTIRPLTDFYIFKE